MRQTPSLRSHLTALPAMARHSVEALYTRLLDLTDDDLFTLSALVLRFPFFLEILSRLQTRERLAEGLRRELWETLSAFYLVYIVVIALSAIYDRASLRARGRVRLHVICDLAFFAAFHLLNNDPDTKMALAYLLPIILAARYLSLGGALLTLAAACALAGLNLVGIWWLRRAIDGEAASLWQWLWSPAMHLSPMRQWVMNVAVFCLGGLPMIRVRELREHDTAQSRHILEQNDQILELTSEDRRRLRLMSEAVTGLARGHDPRDLAAVALEMARAELRCESVALFIYRDGRYHRYSAVGFDEGRFADESYGAGQGLTGLVGVGPGKAEFGAPICLNDVGGDPRVRQTNLRRYAELLPSRQVAHLVAVPLNGANRTFGILRAVNKLAAPGVARLDPDGFSESDQNVLTTVASLLALAYSLSRRSAKSEAISEIHDQLSGPLDDGQVCQAIAAAIGRAGYPACTVLLGDAQQGLRTCAAHGLPAAALAWLDACPDVREARLGAVAGRRQTMAASTLGRPGGPGGPWPGDASLATTLRLPLHRHGLALGLVEIMVPADHTFFEDELRTLRLMAGQAAAATAGARLHADNVHHIGRLQLLAQMTPGLLVHEHEEPLLADAVERFSQLLEAGVCSIYRVDQGLQVLTHVGSRCATVAGLPATPVPISANPHAGLLAYVAATGDTLCFVGGQHRHHPAWDGLALSPASAPGAGDEALLIGPVRNQRGAIVGVVSVEQKLGPQRTAGFSPVDRGLFALLLHQVGAALEKISRIRKLSHLQKVAEKITEAGKIGDVLERIARGAQEVTGADLVLIIPFDQGRQELRVAEAVYLGARSPLKLDTKIREAGLTRQILAAPEGYVAIEDFGAAPEMQSVVGQREGVCATIGIHLRVEAISVGVLHLDYRRPRRLGRDEIEDALPFARLAAIALKNADLLAQKARVSDELSSIQDLTRKALARRELKRDHVIEVVLGHIGDALGFQFVALSLVDERDQTICTYGSVGIARGWQQVSRHPLASDDIQADIVRTQKTEIISGWDPRFDRAIYERYGHDQLVRVFTPIKGRRRERAIGTVEAGYELAVCATISEEQASRLERYLEQVALIIESAQHIERARQYGERLGQLHTLVRQLVSVLPEGPIAQVVARAEVLTAALVGPEARAVVALPDHERAGAARRYGIDLEAPTFAAIRREVEQQGRAVLADGQLWPPPGPQVAAACAPIRMGNEVYGVLWVLAPPGPRFLPEDGELLELCAAQIAATLVSAREHERRLKSQADLVRESEGLFHSFMGVDYHGLQGDIRNLARGTLGPLTAAQRERLEQMSDQLATMQRRITNLFALRSSEAGASILNRRWVPVAQWPRLVTAQLQPFAAEKEIELVPTIDPACARLHTLADDLRVLDVLRELVYNAIKHTQAGGRVEVVLARSSSWLLLSVADNGPGIDPAYHDTIFRKRVQQRRQAGAQAPDDEQAATVSTAGFGLGLHFVRRIVELHNGSVELDSAVGSGARFIIKLPLLTRHPLATMSRRTEEICELRRLDAGEGMRLSRRAVGARELIEQAARPFRAYAEHKGVTIGVEASRDDLSLRLDQERAAAAIEEIICNAVKWTPTGGAVRVSTAVTPTALLIEVSDTGPGIAPRHHETIFAKGFRLPGPPRGPRDAPGLGLYFARAVIQSHGGTVTVASAPGAGARFQVRLPLHEGATLAEHWRPFAYDQREEGG